VSLPEGATSWEEKLSSLQGLLLTGGGDVDPVRYGQSNDEGMSEHLDPRRDDLEMRALQFSLDRGCPCWRSAAGFQFLNVALGGSLLQDIARQTGSPIQHPPDATKDREALRYHSIQVLPDTALASVLGRSGSVPVNSRHIRG